MIHTLTFFILALTSPKAITQERAPVPQAQLESIAFPGVPRGYMILGETPQAPAGYTSTGWTLLAATGDAPCVALGPMSNNREGAPAVEANGKIYLLGGINTKSGLAEPTAIEYDPSSDTWTRKNAQMSMPRLAHAAAVVAGRIFVFGGFAGTQILATVEEYDPDLDQWYVRAQMPTPRQSLAVAAVGDKVYALGGIGTDITALATVEEYDTATDTWQARGPMRIARHSFAATSFDGRVLVFSGATDEYNPIADEWTVRTTATGGSATWATTEGGRILLVSSTAVREYDPATNIFRGLGEFTVYKNDASLACAGDKLFLMGGRGLIDPPPTERFNLGAWRRIYVHRRN